MKKQYIVFIYLIFINGATLLLNNIWYGILFSFIVLLLMLEKKKWFNVKIRNIILIWLLINFISSILFTSIETTFFRIFRYTMLLIILPYGVMSLVGNSFWIIFEKISFKLTLLSLPLFILNWIFPSFFNSLSIIFQNFTYYRLFDHGLSNYWSAFIYSNAIPSTIFYRNSGFMWEPGAFAMLIVLNQVIDWLKNGPKYNFRFSIYLIAMITTLSTAGYIAFFLLILIPVLNKIKISNVIIIGGIIALFWNYVFSFYFIGEELKMYAEDFSGKAMEYDAKNDAFKVNRFTIVYYDFLEVIKNPIGFGVVSKDDFDSQGNIIGVNGLSSLFKMWGIPMFIYFMYLIYHFLDVNRHQKVNKFMLFFMFLALLIVLFSSTSSRSPFIYTIILSSIVFSKGLADRVTFNNVEKTKYLFNRES